MSNKLYVGGLPYSTTESELETMFSELGTVETAVVIMDRDSGRSKGFGFVEMSNQDEADKAIQELNGQSIDGRNITVNEARERAPRQSTGNARW